MIILKVIPERQNYIIGEEIQLVIQISNKYAYPIEIQDPTKLSSSQPEYTVTGPEYPSGKTFSLSSLSREKGDIHKGQSPVPTIKIEPDSIWEDILPLSSIISFTSSGEYKISSSIKSDTITVESPECTFNISELDLQTVYLGLGTRPLEEGEGEGVFIQKSTDAAYLYSFVFKETRPDIGETEIISLVNRGEVSQVANEVIVPWRNSPFFNEMVRWIVWRDGKNIKALNNISLEPSSFELQEEPAYLVKPALKTTGGNVEVIVVLKNEKELSLITINSSSTQPGKSGEIKWKIPLPDKPTEISCALASPNLNNGRNVAFVVHRVNEIEIFYTQYHEASSPVPFQSVKLENAKMLVNAPLAMFVDNEGKVFISVIVVTDEKLHTCALAEAEIDRDGKPIGKIKLLNIGSLPEVLTGGSILYVEKEGKLERRDIVIATESKGLYWSNGLGELRPVSVSGSPTKPILLCPGKDVSYILYAEPNRGLYFEPL
ncbi:MAG: hypothetical protein Q8K98_05195 [Bacteroidota bacterium]|nr:hypothetical protein [Bacteroidota bacterium]